MAQIKRTSAGKKKTSAFVVAAFVILTLYCVAMLVPLLWDLTTSLKSFGEFTLGNVLGLPKKITFQSYATVWNRMTRTLDNGTTVYVEQMFLYTLLYAGGCAFAATFIPCITAYVTSRYSFRFNKIVYGTVIVAMVLPIVGSWPSQIRMAQFLHLYDHIFGMWLLKANFLGMYYLVFHAIFSGIPKGYEEAASIDGAGHAMIMFKIMLPLVKNTFFTVLLLQFIAFWNDWMTPWMLLPSYPTVSVGLMFFTSFNYSAELQSAPVQTAACMTVFIPIFIVFVAFRNKLMGNLTMGGLKG